MRSRYLETLRLSRPWGWDYPASAPGGLYLFDAMTGKQTAILTPTDAVARDFTSLSVGIDGTTVILDATFNDVATAVLLDGTANSLIAQLSADDVVEGDYFGGAVAISGTTAIVGASSKDSSTGAAYLFDTTTGQQIAKLTASDAAAGQYFGFAVAVSGTTAIVGATGNRAHGFNTGAAYLFNTETGAQIAKLTASNAAQGDMFGTSVAISGNIAVVSASQSALDEGEAVRPFCAMRPPARRLRNYAQAMERPATVSAIRSRSREAP